MAIAQYSASALDRATVICFFACREIQLEPTNKQHPEVDHPVSGHPSNPHLKIYIN